MAGKINFQEKTLNAFTMWGSTYNDKPIFARQFTGDMTFPNRDSNRVRIPAISVGFDGEMGRDLGEVLEENMKLKREIEIMTDMREDALRKRIDSIGESIKPFLSKRWWQFWK